MVVPQMSYSTVLLLALLLIIGDQTSELPNSCKIAENDGKNSLEAIAANITEGESECIIIKQNYYLNKHVTFSGLDFLFINGTSDSNTIINCSMSTNAGITLEKITNVTLNHLTLISCGAQFPQRKDQTYSSALRLTNCSDVNIEYLVITESKGIGLTILSHVGGRLLVVWSNFTMNRLPSELKKNISGGGGVYIAEFQHDSNQSVSFEFKHCRFGRNTAHTRYFSSFYSDEFGQGRTGYGQGGGMFLAIENDIIHSSVNLHITDCTYTENEAFRGAGLSTKIGRSRYLSAITRIEITIENSVFTSNGCSKNKNTRIGGGAHLSYNSLSITTAEGIRYTIKNVEFVENCAELGGGIYILSTRFNSTDNKILFDNCNFEKNRAHTGLGN